jgi:diguanylate cyclase (GGDEF)-like protein
MSERLVDLSDPEALLAEIERLHGEVAKLKQQAERLDRLAHQDSLIDLPNRRGFMRQLDMLIARVTRYGEAAAMLYVDVDGLKAINDGFGHKAGDEALIHVAKLLSDGVRKGDCVARIGGDEFGILLNHSDAEGAQETAARLVDLVAEAGFACDDKPLSLSIAIGVAVIEMDDTPETVIARADKAMYREKAAAA